MNGNVCKCLWGKYYTNAPAYIQLEPINFYENIVVDYSWEQSLVSSVMQG
jgi:hypothetical protein